MHAGASGAGAGDAARELARPERYALAHCTLLQSLGRVLHSVTLCTMKYGKYDLHKSSANISVGTSYSWYYRKNDNPTTRKKKRLTRTASDSTLFSDYANQLALFEKEKRRINKKCKKSASDVGKTSRVKCDPRNIKPVYMEPFTGNFFYGKPLPGYEYSEKTEEKITYLPDSDAVTASEDNTGESLTTANTVVDAPEYVRNPLYGCLEADVHIATPELSTTTVSKDSQLKSSSCTELRQTMCCSKEPEDILSNILKDYKRIMKEWNHTIQDHYSSISHNSKRGSTICRGSNTDSYVRSLHSTLSCRKPSRCLKSMTSNTTRSCKKYQNIASQDTKSKSLSRNQTLSNWSSTLQKLRSKTKFWKIQQNLTLSECECLEAIYEDYDRRLQDWCDAISHCSSLISSVLTLISQYVLFLDIVLYSLQAEKFRLDCFCSFFLNSLFSFTGLQRRDRETREPAPPAIYPSGPS